MITDKIPDQPKEWDDPLFESGRQHVLLELNEIVKMRRNFLMQIVEETNNQTYSVEYKKGTIDGFDQVISLIRLLNDWQHDRKRYAHGI